MVIRALPLILPVLLFAIPAHAEDDDLAPLVPSAPKTKAKPKPPPKAKPKPGAKPAAVVQDDDLAPLVVAKTELWVKLAVDVPGAKLFVDGKEVGSMPQGPQAVSAGDHTVTVKRPGFTPFSKKVAVATGKSVEVAAELKASMAVLTITSEPSGAVVFIAGKSVGTTPLEDVETPAGAVIVTAKKEGYADARQDITARAGKDHTVALRLGAEAVAAKPVATKPVVVASKPPVVDDRPAVTNLTPDDNVSSNPVTAETTVQSSPPIVTRWYFWVGVVVVAGAVAAGTAIGVSQANQVKPLSQQEICGGPCDACINCSAAFKF